LTRLRRLAVAAVAATVGLIGLGGLVRATKSGLGCGDDWPHCNGRLLPRVETVATAIELSHRLLAAAVVALVAGLVVAAWRRRRVAPGALRLAVLALGLVVLQSALGAVVVGRRLEAATVTAHLAVAMLLLASLVALTVTLSCLRRPATAGPVVSRSYARLAAWGVGVTFLAILVGAYVRGGHAGLAFPDWPLMGGRLVPPLGERATSHFLHRLLALGTGLLAVALAWRAWRSEPREPAVRAAATAFVALWAAQVLVGAANVWSRLAEPAVVAHVTLAALTWGAAVTLALVARRLSRPAAPLAGEAARARGVRSLGRARQRAGVYLQLTKPRIILLLLVTTVPAMVVAARGAPSGWLVLATLVGGALAAGSANAINCVYDRDIDARMARTRRRPIPARLVDPALALEFGIVLGIVSFAWLARTVNLLAALLAVAAILFYVFVYTVGLKRTTPANIVIGGAAGAVPVLVGWAAVTGRVEVPALALFAIVFLWTPPHFWALALTVERDYRAAGVPMLPVVAGPVATRRRILVYAAATVATTVAFAPLGRMGALYLVTALALGLAFVAQAVRLVRGGSLRAAAGLFRLSIVYLALLFSSMAVDRLLA
jgi:protoheme IX farnesyltransferase